MIITLFLYLAVSAASYGEFKGRGKKERRKKKRASLSTFFFVVGCCFLLFYSKQKQIFSSCLCFY